MILGKSFEAVPASSSLGCMVAAGKSVLANRLRVYLVEGKTVHDGDAPSFFLACNKRMATGQVVGAAERIVSLPYLRPQEMD